MLQRSNGVFQNIKLKIISDAILKNNYNFYPLKNYNLPKTVFYINAYSDIKKYRTVLSKVELKLFEKILKSYRFKFNKKYSISFCNIFKTINLKDKLVELIMDLILISLIQKSNLPFHTYIKMYIQFLKLSTI